MEILIIILLGGYIIYDKQDVIRSYTEPEPQVYNQVVQENQGCQTEVTEIFYSKASGEITICKGKLLQPGEESRIVRVNK